MSDETTKREKERYTETITAGEEGSAGYDTDSESDAGTVIDPDGNVQAPLEDDGA